VNVFARDPLCVAAPSRVAPLDTSWLRRADASRGCVRASAVVARAPQRVATTGLLSSRTVPVAPARSVAPCRTLAVEDQGGALAVRASRPRCRRVALVDVWPPATRDCRRSRAPPPRSALAFRRAPGVRRHGGNVVLC
jgi:hypothetical protein